MFVMKPTRSVVKNVNAKVKTNTSSIQIDVLDLFSGNHNTVSFSTV